MDFQPDDALLRPTARVLLVDDAERLLLFRGESDDTGEGFWFPPGGGLESGETYEQAAIREVKEETGADVSLSPCVWTRRHVVAWAGVRYDCRERWFLARVPAFDIDTSGFTDLEAAVMTTHRWWTLPELANAAERLVPADLAVRLQALLTSGPPHLPIEVGI